MKITKFGHSCLLVEENGVRILIDPGSSMYVSAQNTVQSIDAILITHEHQDHAGVESIKTILGNNPNATIYTNTGVGAVLQKENIVFILLEDGQSVDVKGVLVEAFGKDHAMIVPNLPIVHNTGYRIAKRFFYGGDSVANVVPCEILAYTTLAPWLKIEWAIDNVLKIKPKVCFPVHDAFLKFPGPFYLLPEKMISEHGIEWKVLENGTPYDF